MPSWKIEITTSGGFTGRGIGTMSANSREASRELRTSVENANPAAWQPDYSSGDGHPDEVRYMLTLTSEEREYVTSWRDTTALPADLAELVSHFNV